MLCIHVNKERSEGEVPQIRGVLFEALLRLGGAERVGEEGEAAGGSDDMEKAGSKWKRDPFS